MCDNMAGGHPFLCETQADTLAHAPQLDHLGFENLKKYSTYFSLNLTRSETLMLPKIPPGHSPEIVTPLYVLFEVFEAQMV